MMQSMKLWCFRVLVSLNILLYLTILFLWISIPEHWQLNLWSSIFTFGLSFALIFWKKEEFLKMAKNKMILNFSPRLLNVFLLLAILGLVNYLAYKHPFQWDITKDKKNSLSLQSVEVVRKFSSPLNVKIFARRDQFLGMKSILDLYRAKKSDLNVEFIDPELSPELAQAYQIRRLGEVIFEYMGRRVSLNGDYNELNITNALIELLRVGKKKIYFSIGHGEPALEQEDKNGISHLKQLLEQSAYEVKTLNLASKTQIPADADVLVLMGPRKSFIENELNVIREFVLHGGHLVLALDPDLNVTDKNLRGREVEKLLEDMSGVKVFNNLIVDSILYVRGSNGTVPFANQFDDKHPITKAASKETRVFFPLVSSIDVMNPQAGFTYTKLALSSPYPASWAESSVQEILSGKLTYTEGQDIKGPLAFAVAANNEQTKARIVFIGNSAFVLNVYEKFEDNFNFFLNAISWTAYDDLITSFERPGAKHEGPYLISDISLSVIFYFSIILAPIILALIALWTYWRRKKL